MLNSNIQLLKLKSCGNGFDVYDKVLIEEEIIDREILVQSSENREKSGVTGRMYFPK